MVYQLGLALRPTVFGPEQMKKIARFVERELGSVSYILIPDVAKDYEPIELSLAILGCTSAVKVGPGVIRLLEHDAVQLARRIITIQKLSRNRFVLGAGLGRISKDIHYNINEFFQKLEIISNNLDTKLEIFVAALKERLATRAAEEGYTPLLNFCSSTYAASIAEKIEGSRLACYVKVFYSSKQENAIKNMVYEFYNYSNMPQYRRLFELQGVVQDIERAKLSVDSGDTRIPESLLNICPVNPSAEELGRIIKDTINANVSIPVIYPYFDRSDEENFIISKIKEIFTARI